MNIEILEDGMLIVPETDFEERYLRCYSDQNKLEVFLKHGLSVADLKGLRIRIKNGKE